MRALSTDRIELIDALVSEESIGGVTAGLLEKDEHLTSALDAIFKLHFEFVSLVFCGGTSLSKSHGLIERMSEDADIKVVLSQDALTWSKSKLRNYLGDEVRGGVVNALESIDLVEDMSVRRSLNNNRYSHTQWVYERTYGGITALRPNLQIELTVRTPVLPTKIASISSLADMLAKQTGTKTSVMVVSVAETLAEKVLSFLRRFAQHRAGQMQQNWDTALVRHIYDVHCIVCQQPQALNDALTAFVQLTIGDVDEFGYQDSAFAKNPKAVLKDALSQIKIDQQTRNEYREVLLPLVYGKQKSTFDEAWNSFDNVSQRLLSAL
jgi:predicted nucleotidyltransferase component of viral defense system